MTEQHPATEVEGSFDLSPTALYRLETEAVSAATLPTLPTPYRDALLVFRSPEDAEAFRASPGNHPAAERWRPLGLDREMLAGVLDLHELDLHELDHVVMPHEWTGTGGSDLFVAANFLELLDTSPPA